MLGPDVQALPKLVDAASHTRFMTKPGRCRKVGGLVSGKRNMEARGSFLKKRTKKRLVPRAVARLCQRPQEQSFFCFFFVHKKEGLTSF
jgi:hypothetical protein